MMTRYVMANGTAGNTYTRELSILNAGEVQFQTKFSLSTKVPHLTRDLTISPPALTLSAFERNSITLTYKPTKEVNVISDILIESAYSSDSVHLSLSVSYSRIQSLSVSFSNQLMCVWFASHVCYIRFNCIPTAARLSSN